MEMRGFRKEAGAGASALSSPSRGSADNPKAVKVRAAITPAKVPSPKKTGNIRDRLLLTRSDNS